MELSTVGRALIVTGAVIAVAGLVFLLADKVPLLGRLPGDIRISTNGGEIYVPIATCVLLRIVLTVVVNVALRALRG